MSILLLKSILTTILLALALVQVLSMGQVRGTIKLLPVSTRTLHTIHRWVGDIALILALAVAVLCLTSQYYSAHAIHVPLHVAFGTLAILAMLLKLAIARRFRRQLRYALALGIVAGLSVLGVFFASALLYFMSRT